MPLASCGARYPYLAPRMQRHDAARGAQVLQPPLRGVKATSKRTAVAVGRAAASQPPKDLLYDNEGDIQSFRGIVCEGRKALRQTAAQPFSCMRDRMGAGARCPFRLPQRPRTCMLARWAARSATRARSAGGGASRSAGAARRGPAAGLIIIRGILPNREFYKCIRGILTSKKMY